MIEDSILYLYGHRMSKWQQVRQLAQFHVYLDPETEMAYTHPEFLPAIIRNRLLPMPGFESHSQRAFFIITDNNQLVEYKGLVFPYSNEIVPASGQPRGMLLKEHGEREAMALNAIASRIGGVYGEYHDAGMAIQKREGEGEREGGKITITVTPFIPFINGNDVNEDVKVDGEIIHYGVLRRWGDDYIPFIRLDLFDAVRRLATLEGISHIELLKRAMARLGLILRTAHEIGFYHCFTHPGNIDAHGNLIDFEHAIRRAEIPMLKSLCLKDGDLLDDAHLRYRDIDLFFAGAREVMYRCQACFKLSHDALMKKIRFLREHISLTAGIPVFEVLAHLNIGFYEDTLKKLSFCCQKELIGAFIDNYCESGSGSEVKRGIFSELLRHGEWTPKATGFITNAGNPMPMRQIPNELILNLWKLPPLKKD
ncbi:MAG: hypothetical protein J7J01_02540 [Methanophagales archaeon]|nr:hypothetical protein [Methanophagales archaeon]